jgi:DNA-directed RNA polymerase specialized sigma subunit
MADDLSLIEQIKVSNNESCLKELIAKHSGIYLQIVNQTISDKSNVNKNDIFDDKDLFIYEKALKFDPNRNIKFSTYLGNEIKWKCLNIHNKAKKYEYCDVGDQSEHLVDKDYTKEYLDRESISLIYEKADKFPDSRVRKIIQMRYRDCDKNKLTPWKKIAKKLKLSIQGCINIHNRFIKEVKYELNNN